MFSIAYKKRLVVFPLLLLSILLPSPPLPALPLPSPLLSSLLSLPLPSLSSARSQVSKSPDQLPLFAGYFRQLRCNEVRGGEEQQEERGGGRMVTSSYREFCWVQRLKQIPTTGRFLPLHPPLLISSSSLFLFFVSSLSCLSLLLFSLSFHCHVTS